MVLTVTPDEGLTIDEGIPEWAVAGLLLVLDRIPGDEERGEAFMALWPIYRMAFGIGEFEGMTAEHEGLRRYGRVEARLKKALAEQHGLDDDGWCMGVVADATELWVESFGFGPTKSAVAGVLVELGMSPEVASDTVLRVWPLHEFNETWRRIVAPRPVPLMHKLKDRLKAAGQ